MSKVTMFIIIGVIVMAVVATVAIIHDQKGTSHTMDGNAALLSGNCVVINWDATESTWEVAHAMWVAQRKAEDSK